MNVSILDYGAVSGVKVVNTVAIQNAIDAVAEVDGGRVTVPTGLFLTGTVYLKDNVELHLEMGAVLKASDNLDDYNPLDAYPENWGSDKVDRTGLYHVKNSNNISVTNCDFLG